MTWGHDPDVTHSSGADLASHCACAARRTCRLPYIPLIEVTTTTNNNNNVSTGRKLIGIRGLWYDITQFVHHHPGGAVIEQFVGKDASSVFSVMHTKDVLGKRKPVAYYETIDEEQKKFLELHQKFEQEGFFKTDYRWYAKKVSFAASLLALSVCLIVAGPHFYARLLGGVMLAAFWQQCGFFMHDSEHNQITKDRFKDKLLGTFFGTVCLGVNGSWWRREHHVHHSLTNTVDYHTSFHDPQMKETIWAQNQLLFPFYKTKLEALLIRIQHITFLPICILAGRPAIIIDAMKSERAWDEWLAFFIHVLWTGTLFSYLPTYQEIILIYWLASSLQGILSVQLLLNHYAKPFNKLDKVCHSTKWFRMQVESNINIKCPVFFDWFHGGLNLHIEHHLFPNMPRHNFRKAQTHVRRLCAEMNIEYEEIPFSKALVKTLKHLKTCGELFSLDPR